MRIGELLKFEDRCGANAPFGDIDDTLAGQIVSAVCDRLKIRQDILDLSS